MKAIEHPSVFVPGKVSDTLRATAFEAEQMSRFHDEQLAAIKKYNWLNMFVPRKYNGMELSLPEILRVEEGLAWSDGSSAWVVTLCSGAAWFIGFWQPELVSLVFTQKFVCVAGSGAVAGVATVRPNGFTINGYWPYATGARLATAFTVNCLVQENGQQVFDQDKNPLIKSFVLMPDEVTIHATWNAMGMKATGSNSIEVRSVEVPTSRSFVIHADHATLPHDIFRFPFAQLAETTLAVNISGLVSRFVDLAEDILQKEHPASAKEIMMCRKRLDDARRVFYEQVDDAWNVLMISGTIAEPLLTGLSDASYAMVRRAREVVNDLYPLCGLRAADIRSEINRVWRNLHTAAQHGLFRSLELKLRASRI
jgi:alkylation response protein AidB-like acyl-CoA dehydrogenase